MTVTSQLFEAYLNCPTKCFLQSRTGTGTEQTYSAWAQTQNIAYRIKEIESLKQKAAHSESVSTMLDARSLKSAKWRLTVDSRAHGQNLESTIHAVERVPPGMPGRTAQFIPIRFIFAEKLGRRDKLLLAFDALLLSETLGHPLERGKIIHGEDGTTLNVRMGPLLSEVRTLIAKIATLIVGNSPPDLVLNRHCAECEFQERCRQKAIEKDDLSLLSTMSEKERKDFHNKGIFTVTQLSYTFRPRRRAKEHKGKRERYHHSLKALAIRERKLHIAGSPALRIDGTPVYLDVEGLPDRNFYYLIGIRFKVGDSVVHHSHWAGNSSDEGQIWQEFLSGLTKIENPVLIHYGSFETAFLKRMHERYGGPPPGSGAAKALKSPINLLSVLFGQIYFPTYTNGLKEIAGWLGFRWSAQEASGVQSIIWRSEWERTNAESLKEKLISYNSEDCAALELITRGILQVSSQSAGPNPQATDSLDSLEVVVADNLDTKDTMWPKFRSSIEGFEAINRAARWDYQRDRIYIRIEGKSRQVKRKKKSRAKRTMRIGKVEVCEPSRVCPRCKKQGIHRVRTITKCLHDLKISGCGVRGSIVEYRFPVFRCPACRAFTPWPEAFWHRTRYGRNLAAFCIFETIELCVSQRSVTQTMNRLFGFQMNENVVRRVKERAAEYYSETRKMILAQMVKGNLIHADETRIRLHGKTAYVWVFTTFHEVVYFYSETREGNLVQSALEGFNGVLVSDFYSAYDSMPCPQQKCLLHLMRDLNDAVLDNPYDEGVKGIVTAFAEVLREIVKTTDRWGLRSRFLRKHLVDVARFYKVVSKLRCPSAAALKCKARLERDRDKLFTFLSHDGVPWNNNNAEHAIKAFARLRRAIEGLSTPKGIEDYLILLTVCQSCKYAGIDFLDFLCSGEADLETFAASQHNWLRRNDRHEFYDGGSARQS